ncbi:MAG TPA: alpha/beta fold hydrolase [Gemmatimonadales bacterium]|nr:alpha/beta fold hydrolase [Gemmatimonadales bacterium]
MPISSPRLWAMRAAFRAVGAVAPAVAARWAETLFCTPPRRRGGDEVSLASATRFTLPSQGQQLAGWEWGSGPTVVLVHGWGSRAGRFCTLAAALVEAGFRVVAYDAPAHGESTGRFASLPEFARALRDVAGATGPIHGLVGHSLGGAAVAMAMRDGVEASRVVLLAPPADVRVFSDLFARTLAIGPTVQETMHRNLERRLRIVWDDLHIPSLVRELPAAALVIHDRDDRDVPFAHGEEIVGAWAGSRLETTTGLGHRLLLRDPAVISLTVGFLREGGPA